VNVIGSLADIYLRQRAIMEQGSFRDKLWSTDTKIILWARENSDAELSNEQARKKGMEKLEKLAPRFEEDLEFLPPFKNEPEFHRSFKAWIYARRKSERLLSELEELEEKLANESVDKRPPSE